MNIRITFLNEWIKWSNVPDTREIFSGKTLGARMVVCGAENANF